MARQMPALGDALARGVDKAVSIAEAGELVRLSASRGDVAFMELYPARMEALYEMAFLRAFIAWEVFLEDSFVRYLCGYESSRGPVSLIKPPFPTLDDARADVLDGHDFVSWQRTGTILRRCRKYMLPLTIGATSVRSFHEEVIVSNQARLDSLAAVRNRVAHRSAHSKQEFDTATMLLAGRRYRAGAPGRFLRDWAPLTMPRQRWLRVLAMELCTLASQIVP